MSETRADLRRQWLQRIEAAQRTQGHAAAARIALQATGEGVDDPAVLNLAASALYAGRRFDEAVALLERARTSAPDDADIANSLGICLKALGRTGEALAAYKSAIAADPGLAAAHFNRGTLLEQLNDLTTARAAYECASGLDPGYAEPVASLAWLDSRAGDAAGARERARQALTMAPDNLLAKLALASADLQLGDLDASGAQLAAIGREPGLSPVNRSIALGILGDLKDAEGQPADAFAAYEASNLILKTLNEARFEAPGSASPLHHAERLAQWFEAADRDAWQAAPAMPEQAGGPRTHIFLVGFPRSGTTLLENVLAAHPDVVSLEEKDSLEAASDAFLTSSEGLERLSRLTAAEAEPFRKSYWQFVRGFGVQPEARVFVDKMPLASVAIPLIWKLFPNARVLFARRDPRDVVLSCFRRRFGMNASMYQLLTIDGAAAYYDAVMRLSEVYRDMLPVPRHIVRYESLVEDFEGTARAACEFLGLDWSKDMLDFAARARSRGISTPSAAQVARGLNRDGQGAWRRYEQQMAPVLPKLDPWVRRFGYDA